MDIDLLKSTPDDQIEMMLMTMHMDKPASDTIPGGGSYIDTAMMSFSSGGGGGGGDGSLPQHFNAQDHLPNSPTMLSPQTTISFSNNNNNNIPSNLLSSSFASYSNNSIENASSFPASGTSSSSHKQSSMAAMREMIFRIAAMQPIYIDPEAVKPPKRRNVRISKDPQSVAARHRRERISERIRILQRLVPGGTKMDTASMLDEAIHYVKFLKTQVQSLERAAINRPPIPPASAGIGFPVAMSSSSGYFPVTSHKVNNYSLAVQPHLNASQHNVQQFSDA